jgi:hypothetical protein
MCFVLKRVLVVLWELRRFLGLRVCVLLPISRAKDFVYEKVFQNKLNVKKCEIKVLYWALCILLTIFQISYRH